LRAYPLPPVEHFDLTNKQEGNPAALVERTGLRTETVMNNEKDGTFPSAFQFLPSPRRGAGTTLISILTITPGALPVEGLAQVLESLDDIEHAGPGPRQRLFTHSVWIVIDAAASPGFRAPLACDFASLDAIIHVLKETWNVVLIPDASVTADAAPDLLARYAQQRTQSRLVVILCAEDTLDEWMRVVTKIEPSTKPLVARATELAQ